MIDVPSEPSAESDAQPNQVKNPWEGEPDYDVFFSNFVPCSIQRDDATGSLSGFIVVSAIHPWYAIKNLAEIDCDVHNGLSFSQYGQMEAHSWNMADRPGQKYRVVGFTTASDYQPVTQIGKPEHYKTFAWVEAEVRRLARHARKLRRVTFSRHPLRDK